MKNKQGFTLIELIVSISVITMVTGIFLANYSSSNKRMDLVMTAQKFVADVHLAQNYALGLSRYGNSVSTNVPLGGWGIHINLDNQNLGSGKYVIFADDNGNGFFDAGEDNEGYGAKVFSLPENIFIDATSLGRRADVTFLPPDPITRISDGSVFSTPDNKLTIVLKDLRNGEFKKIDINFLGLIEVTN